MIFEAIIHPTLIPDTDLRTLQANQSVYKLLGNATADLVGIRCYDVFYRASGYGIDGEARAIMDRGCVGFIQKPFVLQDLSKLFRDVLDHRVRE